MGSGEVLTVIFEEEAQSRLRKNKAALSAKSVRRVVGQQAGDAGVVCNLPLVIADEPDLHNLAQLLIERQHLTESPLNGKSLAGRYIGAGLLAVSFPIDEYVGAGALILADVEGCAGDQIVTPVTGAHIVPRPESIATCRSYEGVARVRSRRVKCQPILKGAITVSAKPSPPPLPLRLVPTMSATKEPLAKLTEAHGAK